MNLQETGAILAKMQVTDNRKIDEVTIVEWQETLADVAYIDALEGVRWLRRTTAKWLMPFDVIDAARIAKERRVHAERVAALVSIGPPEALQPLSDDDRAAAEAAFAAGRAEAERIRAERARRRA